MKDQKSVVSMKAKPAFQTVFGVTGSVVGGFRISAEFAASPSLSVIGY